MVRIERITRSSPLYAQEVELRERILLEPIGLDMAGLERMFPGFEERFEHFVAVFDHPTGSRVIGCVVLLAHYPEEGVGKLMQMAVDPQRQREGIGRRLVTALEVRGFGELGLHTVYCHAREDAARFYARLGWFVEGEAFEEAGIPHFKMVLKDEPRE
ncbi:MAG: GNAT family N-acetyltransferase [Phycisphaerales bacterium]